MHLDLRGATSLLVSLVLVSLVLLVVRDIEELNLEARLGGSDHTEPVTKTRALKELLRQILEIALREGNRGLNPDLALALANNLHGVTELARTTIDLDTVMEELLESVGIKNTVVGRTGDCLLYTSDAADE